ncbi:transposase [Kitasatospora sp. NPDC057015]|uniref:transposase n=1 Tax=Kitasatospora sp. NPDC057015 TaxID=3346001 RepID=UPI003634B402
MIEAEATARIGGQWNEHTDTRTTFRNGHRDKTLATAAGDLDLAIPKLRAGSFLPALLERRRRIGQALYAVITEAYVHGGSRDSGEFTGAAGEDHSGAAGGRVAGVCGGADGEASCTDRPRVSAAAR